MLEKQCRTEYDTIKVLREVKLLKGLKSPFVTQLIDIIYPDRDGCEMLCIVLEKMDTDLDQLLKSDQKSFTEKHVIKILYSLLCSISFIHKSNVMHRDMKCANILLTKHCNVKICDFGLARSLPDSLIRPETNTQEVRKRTKNKDKIKEELHNGYRIKSR